jgi:DNA-binding transcriptional LysR family regulator
MQLAHIRTADLNLLPALTVLLEERSISKAAARHHLSQPAMSRVLQRLRETFGDELLMRAGSGYELTQRARQLQYELEALLPRLDRLLRGEAFNPATAADRFRLCAPDVASLLVGTRLANAMAREAPSMQLELVAWHEGVFEDVMRGKLDVAVSAARVPPPLKSEVLFEDNFVCVVSAGHPLAKGPMTAESYFEFPHVRITVLGTERDLVDEQLTALGKERRIGLRVPYLTAAVMAVEDTPLITTTLRRIAEPYAARAKVAILNCPFKLAPGRVLMGWHPRMDAEPAHLWFRQLIAAVARDW